MAKFYKIIKYSRFLILFIVIGLLINFLVYRNSKIICGKISGVTESGGRGGSDIAFHFKMNNIKYERFMDVGLFKKDVSIDSMINMECVEIKYSEYFPSATSRIVDKRVIKE